MERMLRYTTLAVLICLGRFEAMGQAQKLSFTTQPIGAAAGQIFGTQPVIQIQDNSGNLITSSSATVTLAIGTNPGSGTLTGTISVNAVNGVVTFSDLAISRAGNGYTLMASSSGLTGATSSTFNVSAAITLPKASSISFSSRYWYPTPPSPPTSSNYLSTMETLLASSPTTGYCDAALTTTGTMSSFFQPQNVCASGAHTNMAVRTRAIFTPTSAMVGARFWFRFRGDFELGHLFRVAGTDRYFSSNQGGSWDATISLSPITLTSTSPTVIDYIGYEDCCSGGIAIEWSSDNVNWSTIEYDPLNATLFLGGSGDGHAMSTSPLAAAPLPVTWLEFTGEMVKEQVRLNWQTANEQNTSHFEIERSANGGEYTRIGSVQAAGNSVNIRSYEFWDETPPVGTLLYRLRQVDIDARYSYSKVVMLRNTAKSMAKIGPNPTGGAITLQIPADWGSNVEWRLYNTQGQLLGQRSKMVSGNYTIDLSARASGTYQLTLWKNGELAQKEWIIRR